jgi:uncharacterized protein YndB with AHSA1/START domain
MSMCSKSQGCEGTQKIAPKSKISYCWDEPQQNDKRLLLTVANTTTTFALSLDKIGRCRPAKLPDQERSLLLSVKCVIVLIFLFHSFLL